MRTRLVESSVICSAIALFLSGCGIMNWCNNKCPEGWVHGSADCGCMEKIPEKKSGENQNNNDPADNAYYITRRYSCVDANDANKDRGSCDVTGRGASCAAALNEVRTSLSSVPDPCRVCANTIDKSRVWNGDSTDIQGGPCQDWSQLAPKPALTMHAGGASRRPTPTNALYSPMPGSAALLHLLRTISAAPTDNSVATCRKTCSSGSPYCLVAELDQSRSQQLGKLQALLLSKPSSISKAKLMQMFDVDSDECKRGDTSIEHGTISNLGEQCALNVDTPVTAITVAIPELLRGTAAIGDTAIFLFDEPQNRAKLKFSDPGLDADWGGDIVSASTGQGFVAFSVGTQSCVRVSLE